MRIYQLDQRQPTSGRQLPNWSGLVASASPPSKSNSAKRTDPDKFRYSASCICYLIRKFSFRLISPCPRLETQSHLPRCFKHKHCCQWLLLSPFSLSVLRTCPTTAPAPANPNPALATEQPKNSSRPSSLACSLLLVVALLLPFSKLSATALKSPLPAVSVEPRFTYPHILLSYFANWHRSFSRPLFSRHRHSLSSPVCTPTTLPPHSQPCSPLFSRLGCVSLGTAAFGIFLLKPCPLSRRTFSLPFSSFCGKHFDKQRLIYTHKNTGRSNKAPRHRKPCIYAFGNLQPTICSLQSAPAQASLYEIDDQGRRSLFSKP